MLKWEFVVCIAGKEQVTVDFPVTAMALIKDHLIQDKGEPEDITIRVRTRKDAKLGL